MNKEKIEKKLGRKFTEKENQIFEIYNQKARIDFKIDNGSVSYFKTCWCGEKVSSNSDIYCLRHYNQYM